MANEYVVTFRFPADQAGEFFTKFAPVMPLVQQFECISFEPEAEEPREAQNLPEPEPVSKHAVTIARTPYKPPITYTRKTPTGLSAEQFIVQHFKNKPHFTLQEAAGVLESGGWARTSAPPTVAKGGRDGVFTKLDHGVWRVTRPTDAKPAKLSPEEYLETKMRGVSPEREATKTSNRSIGQIMGKGKPEPGAPSAYEFIRDHFKNEEIFHVDQVRTALLENGWSPNSASPTLSKGRDRFHFFEALGDNYWRVYPKETWVKTPHELNRENLKLAEQPEWPEQLA